MKKLVIIVVIVAAIAGAAFYAGVRSNSPAPGTQTAAAPSAGRGGGGRGAGGAGRGGGRGSAGPLTVEVAIAHKGPVAQELVVVGNLIGDATVSVVPRAAGRLQTISVRLGDAVRRGQRIASIEDYELREQVKQQEAALEVARATIRQREADLQLAETNAERSRNLFARQLLPKQALDDTEARYQSAVAQLDLARAQNTQSLARLEELRINLANTQIVSPVNGFVARRTADPGAFVSPNAPIVDVVDIGRVRLVANIVEKDLKQIRAGDNTQVEVDAFPGQTFIGRIARIAPVLDPSTRTASIEVEIPNPGYRLKPGMYARVIVTTDVRRDALVVPTNAVVDFGNQRGVFMAATDGTVSFRPVRLGIEAADRIEIVDGLTAGDRVVTTGSGALRDGQQVVVLGEHPTPAVADESDGPSRPGPRGGGGQRGGGTR